MRLSRRQPEPPRSEIPGLTSDPEFQPVLEQALLDRDIEFATEILTRQQELDVLTVMDWLEKQVDRARQISKADTKPWHELIRSYSQKLLGSKPEQLYSVSERLQQANVQAAAEVLGLENRSRKLP